MGIIRAFLADLAFTVSRCSIPLELALTLNKRLGFFIDISFYFKRVIPIPHHLAKSRPRFSAGIHIVCYYLLQVFREGKLIHEFAFDRCFDFGLVDIESEFPVIECWSRGGGGLYSRAIYRVVGDKYHITRIERFHMSKAKATRPSYTVQPEWIASEGDGRLYFVEADDRTPTAP